jgi:hypothetical protein
MADGFLSRWSQRKEAVRQGKEVEKEPEAPAADTPSAEQPAELPSAPVDRPPPPPTLQDAQALTTESDFTRFVKPDVAPEVRNAAMKKLFSDPHFNVMDGLDTYIDDYSRPDPMPPEMLKQLASAKFLRLFEEEEKEEQTGPDAAAEREVADAPPSESVAQSSSRTEQALPPADDHADPDLRLQQDDAPGPAGPGAGSG